jgi:hypothetical protein
MQSNLFEFLENADLVVRDSVNENRIATLSGRELSDIGIEAANVSDPANVAQAHSVYSHSATLSLGGGTSQCAYIGCRINHISRLAQFAAFYSDRVYIHNFLADHSPEVHCGAPGPIDIRRREIYDDLQVLLSVRPLIEAGVLVPVSSPTGVCNQCITEGAFGPGAHERLEAERNRLGQRYLREVQQSVEYSSRRWAIECEGPEELLEHGGSYISYSKMPAPFAKLPGVLARIRNGEQVRLQLHQRQLLGYHDALAADVISDVLFEMAMSQLLGSSFLSERELPLEVLANISGDPEMDRRNLLVQKHLTSMVPFVGDISLGDLIELRKREEGAFIAYRQSLNLAVEQALAKRNRFTERDAKSVYADIIAPDLARLDRAVKNAKRDLSKGIFHSAAAWVGAISFGIYSGILPTQLIPLANSIGLAGFVKDTLQKGASLLNRDDGIRNEQMYFLWRVKERARR